MLTFIQNPYTMFNKILYDDNTINYGELLNTLNFDEYSNTYVKVIVRTKNNPYWFDMFIDKLEKSDPIMIQVVDDNFNLQLEDDDDIINEAEDTLTILKRFVDTVEISTDKKEIDKFLSELYAEASSI